MHYIKGVSRKVNFVTQHFKIRPFCPPESTIRLNKKLRSIKMADISLLIVQFNNSSGLLNSPSDPQEGFPLQQQVH